MAPRKSSCGNPFSLAPRVVLALVAGAFLGACTRTETIQPEVTPAATPTAVPAPVQSSQQVTAVPVAPTAEPFRPKTFDGSKLLLSDFAPVGTPCPKDRPDGGPLAAAMECGKDGKVSRVLGGGTGTLAATFPGATLIAVERPFDGATHGVDMYGAGTARVMFEGERVWLEEDCMVCRISNRQVTLVALDLATDPQIDALQARLRLPKSPRLTTVASWRSALTSNRRLR
ncbi:MAG: hypothetical protein U0169_11245 [Polyangiaceae bacterium]